MPRHHAIEELENTIQQLEKERNELQQRYNELALMFSMSPDMVCIADLQTARFLTLNSAFKETLGYEEEEMLGESFFDFIYPNDLERTRSILEEELRLGKKVFHFENRYICKDGSDKWLSWVSRPDLEKGVTYAIARDITPLKEKERALQESEELYKGLFTSTNDGICLHELVYQDGIPVDYMIVDINPKFEESTGISREDAVGFRATQVYGTQEAPYLEIYAEVAKSGKPTSFETYYAPMDKHFLISVFSPGEHRFATVFQDISHLKEAIEALAESEKRYKSVLGAVNEGILLQSASGEILTWNKGAETILGIPARDALGKSSENRDWQTIHEDGSEYKGHDHPSMRTLRTGTPLRKEIMGVYWPDGTLRWISINTKPLFRKEDEGPYAVVVSFSDITEQKRTEEERKRLETQLSNAIEMAALAPWEYDLLNDTFHFNDHFYKLLKISAEEVGGYTMPSSEYAKRFIHPDDMHLMEENIQQAIQEVDPANTIQLEHRVLFGDKTTGQIFVQFHVVKDAQGRTVKTVGVNQDITDRKRMEAQLQQAQKMESIGQLAGGVAHDLNNILSGLVSYPDMLLINMSADDPMSKPLEIIKKSGERAANIVQDLLTLARRGVGSMKPLNLNTLIQDFTNSPEYAGIWQWAKNVDVCTSLDTELLNIKGQDSHLTKVLMNLLTNGVEAMSGNGVLTLSTQNRYLDKNQMGYESIPAGEYVVLSVTDTGIGISEDELPRIFEPFFTKKKTGRSGTGLGMAVVWGVLKDHEAFIDIRSEPGSGTTFEIFFPVTREALKTREHASPEQFRGKGQRILVVDDIEEQRNLAMDILSHMGYEVELAASGEQAVALCQSSQYDLLLLDMIMPGGISGLVTYEKVCDISRNQKAIIASGFSDPPNVKMARELGVGSYITKPYTVNSLAEAVYRVLSS